MATEKLRTLFALFDVDGSGYLEREECKKILTRSAPGLSPLAAPNADAFIAEFDTSGDGKIDLEEFCSALGGALNDEVEVLLKGHTVKITVVSLTGSRAEHTLTANGTVRTLMESINDKTGVPLSQLRLFCEVPVGLDDAFGGQQLSYAGLPGYTLENEWPEAIKQRPFVHLHSSASLASLMSVGSSSSKRANACSRVVEEGLICWEFVSLRPVRPRAIPDDEKISRSSMKRVQAELQEFVTVCPERLLAAPINEEDLGRWKVTVMGPPATPYAKGTFAAILTLPEKYPFAPPLFHFTTKLYHCNVDEEGVVHLPLLLGPRHEGGDWSPGHTITTVIDAVYAMMSTPMPEYAARPEIAEQLGGDRSAHDATAAEWTDKFAT